LIHSIWPESDYKKYRKNYKHEKHLHCTGQKIEVAEPMKPDDELLKADVKIWPSEIITIS